MVYTLTSRKETVLPLLQLEHQRPLTRPFQLPQSYYRLLSALRFQNPFSSPWELLSHSVTFLFYVKQLPYLKNLCLNHATSDNDNINISMLIGADEYWSIVQKTVIRGSGPTAVESEIGYLLSGPLYNYTTSMTSSVFHLCSVSLYDSPNVTPSGDMWELTLYNTNNHLSFCRSTFMTQ